MLLEVLRTTFGVFEMRVAAVDDDVALVEKGKKFGDDRVDRRVLGIEREFRSGNGVFRLNHQHNFARAFELGNQLFEGVCADELIALGLRFGGREEIVDLASRAVEDRDVKAMIHHVQNEILAHDR